MNIYKLLANIFRVILNILEAIHQSKQAREKKMQIWDVALASDWLEQ